MRRTRRRRGISYILSVVMMTLVVSSMAGVVLVWGLGQIGESRTTLSTAIRARIERTQERVVIEDVQFFPSDNTITVYIRNVGGIQIVVDRVYVNHIGISIANKLSLSIGAIGYVNVSVPGLTISTGTTYLVKVATTRGATDFGNWSS